MFFRELKGQLGLQDYQGTQFASYERFVTLTLLGYMVLEYQRVRGLKRQLPGQAPRGGWETARTAALLQQVRQEATQADVRWLRERLKTRSGRRQLDQALRRAERRPAARPPAEGPQRQNHRSAAGKTRLRV